MEQLSETVGILCILIMVMGLLADIGSFPATEKIIRFITAIYIIVAFFKAFQTSDKEISINMPTQSNTYSNSEYLKSEIISKTESELQYIIESRLEEKNISYNSVTVHILEQNSNLVAEEICIVCDDEGAALECIEDIATKDTKIIIGE